MAGHHCNGLTYFILAILLQFWISTPVTQCDLLEGFDQEINVSQAPSFIYALRNNSLTISCGVSVPLDDVLSSWWLKNGVVLQNWTGIKYSGLDLSFDRAEHANDTGGVYRCVVKLKTGMVLGPVTHLSLVELEVTAENATVADAYIGQNVILHCGVKSTPLGNVTWTRVPEGQLDSRRYHLLGSGNLLITRLEIGDAGTFRCTIGNYLLRTKKQSLVHLHVQETNTHYAPEILNTFENKLTLSEDSSRLVCVANGNPRPSLKWVLNFESENEVIRGHVVSLGGIINLNEQNSTGNYSCIASNSFGEVLKSVYANHEVSFLDLPAISSFPASKTVRLECKYAVAPLWYKNGEILHRSRGRVRQKNNELLISSTIQDDSGFYQCESGGYIATSRLRVLVSTKEQPEAPVHLSCDSKSSRSVFVRWKLIVGGNVQAFTIHYMPVEGGEERQHVTNNTTTSLLIESLTPNTNYSLYVRSYSGRSASGQSEKVFCTTFADYPSATPKLIILDQIGPSSQFRLKWKRLTNEEARGRILWYKLQWRIEDGNFNNIQYLHGDSEEFILTGLLPSSRYLARLLPATSAGYPLRQKEFNWTVFTTGLKSMNSSITHPSLEISFLNSTSIDVNWKLEFPLPHGQTLRGFRIILGEYNDRVGEILYQPLFELGPERNGFTFTGLEPTTQYEVNVQCFSDNWESDLAIKHIKTTNGDDSNHVGEFASVNGLEATPYSSTEIGLRWLRPDDIIDYYIIRFSSVDSTVSSFVESNTENVTIGNLIPYTSYEFVVAYNTLGNSSPFSQKVETMTLEGKPGPPVYPQFQVLNKTSIQLEWLKPLQPNGLITRYVVEFTNSTGGPSFLYTNTNNIVLTNLQPNKDYHVRIAAETKAGVGIFSDILSPKIFSVPEKAHSGEASNMSNPSNSNTTNGYFSGMSQQQLGIILGSILGLTSIMLCAIILGQRKRCFALLVSRNGRTPEGTDIVDSAPVEMKILNANDHCTSLLDTKGGHPNGLIRDEICDPLLLGRTRTPVQRSRDGISSSGMKNTPTSSAN